MWFLKVIHSQCLFLNSRYIHLIINFRHPHIPEWLYRLPQLPWWDGIGVLTAHVFYFWWWHLRNKYDLKTYSFEFLLCYTCFKVWNANISIYSLSLEGGIGGNCLTNEKKTREKSKVTGNTLHIHIHIQLSFCFRIKINWSQPLWPRCELGPGLLGLKRLSLLGE